MSEQTLLNPVSYLLQPYPMEELARIKKGLEVKQQAVFDFGTGDPQIPIWPPIGEAISQSINNLNQYPSISGTDELQAAQAHYLRQRFGLEAKPDLVVLPSHGSKEAIFHIALSVVGRANGRRRIIYPDPGYPVYQSSILFAGGIPTPVQLDASSGFRLEPWKLPKAITKDCAALWVNYPHNPSGTLAPLSYWQELIDWCHLNDVVLLSDDCYVDLYDASFDRDPKLAERIPINPLQLSCDRVLSFMSLSKRSGLTGYRIGMIVGDARIMRTHARARANFGVAIPGCLQAGACVAWRDESHVQARRDIFTRRIDLAAPVLMRLGLLDNKPEAAFYLWCRVPKAFPGDDVRFCLELAKEGLIMSPSSWLSEGIKGYFRMALVPDEKGMMQALDIFSRFVQPYL